MTQARNAGIASFGASPAEVEELLQYNINRFDLSLSSTLKFPLPDEPFLEVWRSYADEVSQEGNLSAIYRWLPQLQFPIQENLPSLPEYEDAIKRGRFIYPNEVARGLNLNRPDLCRIAIHPTAAGQLPILTADCRSDFVALIRAFTKKGEPLPIPDSMGAVIITGYNNFHRIHMLRDAFLANTHDEGSWTAEFARIKQQKNLYQDKFVILGSGPYSGVSASSLNQTEDEWIQMSLRIRLEHECTHYFTRRVFGSMQNNLIDELLADFLGIVSVTGSYNPKWALYFLGLEDRLEYRRGGRLENYRGTPPLTDGAFRVLQKIVRAAIANLEMLDQASRDHEKCFAYQAATIHSIASFTLDELAVPDSGYRLTEKYYKFRTDLDEANIDKNSDDSNILNRR